MSIATNEAEKLPILASIYKKADLYHNVITFAGANDVAKAAYIAGRTAEPTAEEVKAVADELAAWNFDVAMNSGATIHGATADFSSRSFELLAKRVLNAARKAAASSRERES
jgi:3-deoxy-D-arabino-heptulosonate 7-phosphate (DAHP) synthase class II